MAQQLGNKDTLNIRRFTTSKVLHSLVKVANLDGLKQTRVGNATAINIKITNTNEAKIKIEDHKRKKIIS